MNSQNIKLAFRNMQNHKALTLLKTISLGIGLAASILLAIYINAQWKFDRFHSKSGQIVRINALSDHEKNQFKGSALTYSGLGPWAVDQFQEVKSSVRMARWIANDVVLRFGDKVIRDDAFLFVDSNFLEVFSFDLIEGSKQGILVRPNTIVITASKAKAFFGDESALGKSILFDGRKPFLVTGVLKDPPKESHIQFSALCPMTTIQEYGMDMYKDHHFEYAAVFTYLELADNVSISDLGKKLNDQFDKDFAGNKLTKRFEVHPLTDIHMDNEIQYGLGQSINGANIWTLMGISFLILAMCWINHFNLFTAETVGKSRMLSIRRIIGAERRDVWNQLSVNAMVTNVIGIGFGLVFSVFGVWLLKDHFEWFASSVSSFYWAIDSPAFLILLFIIVGTILSVVLPAFILSSGDILGILQPHLQKTAQGINIRKSLLVFQFAVMIALTSFGVLIYQQTKFVLNKPIEINLDQVTILRSPLGFAYKDNQDIYFNHFYEEMMKRPDVESVGFSGNIPGQVLSPFEQTFFEGNEVSNLLHRNFVTTDYFDVFQFKFLGKADNYSNLISNNAYGVINESAMRILGFDHPKDAIGKRIKNYDNYLEIVGVVNDHHQLSLHHAKQAILFDFNGNSKGYEDGYYEIKYKENTDISDAIKATENIFHASFPFAAFDSFSAKDFYYKQYQGDNSFLSMILLFIILSFLIGCFGLVGISILEFGRRTKEVAIRKTLGASVTSIMTLLFENIMRLTAIAFVISVPVAYYFMNEWLMKFTYKVGLSWQVFAISGMSTVLVVFLVLISQAKKAAEANPVESLKQ